MKLFQVRKGQFVYFNNELHKVYSVKPMYKQSIHLIKLRDLSQHLTTASNIERYKPMEHDSFIFNHKVYTLSNEKVAVEGDFILITNPQPDYLDRYSLNEIEVVATVEKKGVITNRSNGIKHNEYLLMVPGRNEKSRPIDFKDTQNIEEEINENDQEPIGNYDAHQPTLGDVYKNIENIHNINEAMVVAIQDQKVFLGNGLELLQSELMNNERWEYLYNLLDN